MAQSLNTKVDLKINATSYRGIGTYGAVMVGDKAYEFYNNRNVEDYIQIPWNEIDHIEASVIFRGKWISRFVIMTKTNGNFSFSSRDNKKLLRAIQEYIDPKRLVKSISFFGVIKNGVKSIFTRKSRQ